VIRHPVVGLALGLKQTLVIDVGGNELTSEGKKHRAGNRNKTGTDIHSDLPFADDCRTVGSLAKRRFSLALEPALAQLRADFPLADACLFVRRGIPPDRLF
jgi:hypothetical protein